MDDNSAYSFVKEPTIGQPANATNDPTSSDTGGYSFVKENPSGTPQDVGPINPPDRSLEDYGKAFLRGAAKATGTLPDDIDQVLQSYPYTPAEHIGEKAGMGTAFGAPFGLFSGPIPGAISGATEEGINQAAPHHEILASGAGIITGLGAAPIISNLAEFGAKSARSIPEQFGMFKSPVNSLYSDIGNTQRIAGANDSWTSLMQVQNALREGLGGSGQIRDAEQKIFNAVETRAKSIADNLGPDLTHQELGEYIQHHATLRADQIRGEISSMYTALDAIVPKTTQIDPANFTNMLHSIESKYAGAPELGKVFQQSGIQKYLDAVNADLWSSPTGTIPYDVIKNMRTDIGEMIEKGALNPNVNVKELRGLYSSLTRDMEGAYTSPGALRAFQTVNTAAEKGFDTLANTIEPLVKIGLSPETITTRLLAQANKGSSRIDDITSQLNNIDPNARSTVMGYVLRNMGETAQKNFNPATFYGNWQKLSPEAKDLFPRAQQEGIDRLGRLSGLIADSFDAANRPHTSGNLSILERIGTGLRLLAGAAGTGAGGVAGHIAGQEPIVTGMVGGNLAGALSAFVGESTVNNMLAKLWTNKAFNTWIATEAPDLAPNKLSASMTALAAQEPQIADGLNYLSAFIGGSTPKGPQPGEKGRGFQEGGFAEWPEQANSQYAEGGTVGDDYNTKLSPEEEDLFTSWKKYNAPNDSGADYDLRGAFKDNLNPADNGHWSDKFKKPNHDTFSDESKYAKEHPDLPRGSWGGKDHDIYQPPAGYALGGLTHTPKGTQNRGHPNKFKGKQLQGFAEGGTVPDIDTPGGIEYKNPELEGEEKPSGRSGMDYTNGAQAGPGTRDDLWEHEKAGMSPEERQMKLAPSYAEDSIIPSTSQAIIDLFIKEHKAAPDSTERERDIRNMMANRKAIDTPVWPHSQSFEDAIYGRPNSYVGGGAVWDGYAEGGKVFSANDNKDSTSGIDWDKYKIQPVGMMKNPPKPSIIDTVMKTIPMGSANDFAQGGISHTSTKKAFYNPEPIDINQGGWADGGVINSYADGGTTDAKTIDMESGNHPNAKNPRSSASGLGQFIDSTWINMMRKYHPEIANPLAVKNDPALQTEMVGKYREENSAYLQSMGLPVTDTTIYLSHFLGPAGAAKVLTSDPNTPVGSLFDAKVTKANPQIKNMTSAQLVNMIEKKRGGKTGETTLAASHHVMPNAGTEDNSTEQEEPSIIDTILAQNGQEPEADEDKGEDMNEPLKSAIGEAPWIRPETKIASRAILES